MKNSNHSVAITIVEGTPNIFVLILAMLVSFALIWIVPQRWKVLNHGTRKWSQAQRNPIWNCFSLETSPILYIIRTSMRHCNWPKNWMLNIGRVLSNAMLLIFASFCQIDDQCHWIVSSHCLCNVWTTITKVASGIHQRATKRHQQRTNIQWSIQTHGKQTTCR